MANFAHLSLGRAQPWDSVVLDYPDPPVNPVCRVNSDSDSDSRTSLVLRIFAMHSVPRSVAILL